MRQLLFALLIGTAFACVQRVEIGEIVEAGTGGGGEAGAPPLELERFETPLVASSATTCARASSGGILCWGSNTLGQLGVGDENLDSSSMPVTPLGWGSGASAIYGGGSAYCGMRDNGRVDCWGYVIFGLFNDMPIYASTLEPLEMPFIGDDTVQIVAGSEWLCLLTRAGQPKCWGVGASGQLGNGSTDDAYLPHDVAGDERYLQLAASGFHSCGVTASGGVMCWGHNGSGELGAPGPNQLVPTAVAIDDVANIAAGARHSCAKKQDGSIWCWGDNALGQLGGATASGGPVAIPNVPSATALSAGGDQTCLLTAEGAVWCWGVVNDAVPTLPIEVLDASFGATAVSCGSFHACAMNAAHLVRCWGENFSGQAGDGELQL